MLDEERVKNEKQRVFMRYKRRSIRTCPRRTSESDGKKDSLKRNKNGLKGTQNYFTSGELYNSCATRMVTSCQLTRLYLNTVASMRNGLLNR